MKRICLSGTFHSGNRGDASIQLSAILELRSRFPDAQLTLLSCSPRDDAPFYPGAQIIPCSRRRPVRAILRLAEALSHRLLRLPPIMLSADIRVLVAADKLLDFSGDGFTGTFGWKCPASHAVPLLIARILGTHYALVGQTIGPFGRGDAFYRWLFNGAQSVLCRDQESFDRMVQLGVRPSILRLTADPAFLLPPAPFETVSFAYPQLAAFLGDRPVCGVTPSNLHNIRAVGNGDQVMDALTAACLRLIQETGCRILIIPTVFGPGAVYDDRRASRILQERLPEGTALVCDQDLGPQELKALIGRCDVFLGLRMHALIAALSQAVPSLAIAYAPKTTSLFARLGMPDLCVTAEEVQPTDLASRASELWSRRNEVAEDLRVRVLPEILAAARANFEAIETQS